MDEEEEEEQEEERWKDGKRGNKKRSIQVNYCGSTGSIDSCLLKRCIERSSEASDLAMLRQRRASSQSYCRQLVSL